MHSIVCLDGNFEHKRARNAGKSDQPLIEPQSFFLPNHTVAQMEKEVSAKRQKRPRHPMQDDSDSILPGLKLQNHVFDGCSDRFYAANESNRKADASYYVDTGLMAMTCRHDRLVYMVNMHDSGEKQHYAFALIKQLFDELPKVWDIGILYDIGCQIHKSVQKVFLTFLYFCSD